MTAASSSAVPPERLQEIYAGGDDPWKFRTSTYEQAKFRATRAALGRDHYVSALEVGCGNGELARHLAPLCDAYTGLDAVPAALASAGRAVPHGRFVEAVLPCPLPEGPHDLIVLSEILYFLDAAGIRDLARQIADRWPRAEIVVVTWLGPSGNPIEGEAALAFFMREMEPAFATDRRAGGEGYRIDGLIAR